MKRVIIGVAILFLCTINGASAVERRSCRCGFTAAGDCKPCSGSGGAVVRGKECMYGYDEAGNCLKEDKTIMKRCLCGYDAGGCLPCKDSIIDKDSVKSEE